MSVLGQNLKKVASEGQVDTERLVKIARERAECFIRAHEKFASFQEDELAKYAEAVQAGVALAHAELPTLVQRVKTASLPVEVVANPLDTEETATVSAAIAEKLAEVTDKEELADPDVQMGIVTLAAELTESAIGEGLFHAPEPKGEEEKKEGKDEEGAGKDEEEDKKDD